MRHGSQLTGLSRVRNVLTATITQSDNGPDNGWGLFVSKTRNAQAVLCEPTDPIPEQRVPRRLILDPPMVWV